MHDVTTPVSGLAAADPSLLAQELDRLVDLAWEPGWAPLAMQQLIALCGTLREQPERWPQARAMMRGHAIGRLMREDPLVFHAVTRKVSRPRYLDLVLGHPEAAALSQGVSRAGRELFGVNRALPLFNALRNRTAYLGSMVDAVAELQPGAEVLTLRAGHLREAAGVAKLRQVGRWMVLEPDNASRAVLCRGLPAGLSVQTMRGSLRGFGRRPFRRGCFDLVCLPRMPDCPAAEQKDLLEAAFSVLKPGGRLLVCAAGRPVPEDAWIETFLESHIRWTARRELEALLGVIPPADCANRSLFHSLDGHQLHAILQRRG
jgi:SAM-dependent methyltransferase